MTASPAMLRLQKQARVHLPGVLDDVLLLETFAVLQEFLSDTNVWRKDVTFNVVAPGTTYTVAPASTASIVRLVGVTDSSGAPVTAGMPTIGEVVLANAPAADDTYTARFSLTVTDPVGSDGFPYYPEWVLEKYNLELLDGLLGRVMAQPAKPYTNATLALLHMRAFKSAKATAKTETNRQYLYGNQTWTFPRTFKRTTRL